MNLYNVPSYIKIRQKDNFLFIENKLSGSVLKLSEPYHEEFKSLFNNGTNLIDSELKKFLNENNFLITKDVFSKYLNNLLDYNDSLLNIIIMPTEYCNFNCTYCYEKKDKIFMKEEYYTGIINYILENYHNKESICINWFGGEPTLKYKDIIKYNNIFHQIAKEKNIKFYSSITTNGYILNKKIFKQLIDAGVNDYQITIDGEQHDEFRVLKNGKPTKNIILKNLCDIRDTDFNFKIVIRRNIDNDSNYEFYNEIYEKFKNDTRFELLIHKIFKTDDIKSEDIKFIENDKILEDHIGYARKVGLLIYNNNNFIKTCYAFKKSSIVVRPNGEILKCTVHLNERKNKVGKINGLVKLYENKNKSWYKFKILDKCIICENLTNCNLMKCPAVHLFSKKICNFKRKEYSCEL